MFRTRAEKKEEVTLRLRGGTSVDHITRVYGGRAGAGISGSGVAGGGYAPYTGAGWLIMMSAICQLNFLYPGLGVVGLSVGI